MIAIACSWQCVLWWTEYESQNNTNNDAIAAVYSFKNPEKSMCMLYVIRLWWLNEPYIPILGT